MYFSNFKITPMVSAKLRVILYEYTNRYFFIAIESCMHCNTNVLKELSALHLRLYNSN